MNLFELQALWQQQTNENKPNYCSSKFWKLGNIILRAYNCNNNENSRNDQNFSFDTTLES